MDTRTNNTKTYVVNEIIDTITGEDISKLRKKGEHVKTFAKKNNIIILKIEENEITRIYNDTEYRITTKRYLCEWYPQNKLF